MTMTVYTSSIEPVWKQAWFHSSFSTEDLATTDTNDNRHHLTYALKAVFRSKEVMHEIVEQLKDYTLLFALFSMGNVSTASDLAA